MRVVFMGTPDFAIPALEALVSSGRHTVSLVVTQPDRPKGRSGAPAPSDVKRCALSHDLPVYQPARIRSPEAVARLREENPDIIVVAAFGQILSKEILDLPTYGCINIHGSLLPKYRGAAPVQWAVIDGQEEAGDTIMQMDEGLDTGDILLQERIALSPDETGGSLYDRLSQMGGPLLLRALDLLEAGMLTPIPQKESEATHVGKISRQMGELDFTRPALSLEHLVRGLNPRPGAYTHWNGRLLKIWMARALPQDAAGKGDICSPGCIVRAEDGLLLVQTGEGLLSLTEVQLEGKRRLSAEDFLRGSRMREGERLV